MATFPYPTLDSISAFTVVGSNVTATVSFTNVRAPGYTNGSSNVYTSGRLIYITGANNSSNNGSYTIVSSTSSNVTYTNSNGLTQSNQFALCSVAPVMTPDIPGPIEVYAAEPFSYTNTVTPATWNPPPTYTTTSFPIVALGTGATTGTTTQVTTVSSIAGQVSLEYASYSLNDLYPYDFSPSITIPLLSGNVNGNFSPDNLNTNCELIGGVYPAGSPGPMAIDSSNGILYVIDADQRIRKVTLATQSAITIIGLTVSTYLTTPKGIAFDSSRNCLYVSNPTQIIKIDLSVTPCTSTVILSDGDEFGYAGIVIDPTNTYLYVANNTKQGTSTITRVTLGASPTTTRLNVNVNNPYALAMNVSGTLLYIATTSSFGLHSYLIAGPNTLSTWISDTGGSPGFWGSIAVNNTDGFLYFSDNDLDPKIYTFSLTPPGVPFTMATFPPAGVPTIPVSGPRNIVYDALSGILYTSSPLQKIVVGVNPVSTVPYTGTFLGSAPIAVNQVNGNIIVGSSTGILVNGTFVDAGVQVSDIAVNAANDMFLVCTDGTIRRGNAPTVVLISLGYSGPYHITMDQDPYATGPTVYVTYYDPLEGNTELTSFLFETGFDIQENFLAFLGYNITAITTDYTNLFLATTGGEILVLDYAGDEVYSPVSLAGVYGLAYGGGYIYASSTVGTISRMDPDTSPITVIAGAAASLTMDGRGTAARFTTPYAIAYDVLNGALVVMESTAKIRYINLTQTYSPLRLVLGSLSGNMITIGGVQYSYSTSITLRCTPTGSNAFTLDINGATGPSITSSVVKMSLVSTTSASSLVFTYTGPLQITSHTATETPTLVLNSTAASGALLGFVEYDANTVVLSSITGFTSIPSPNTMPYTISVGSSYLGAQISSLSNTFTVGQIPIIATPVLESPLTLYEYSPFSYVFTLPDDVVNVILNASATSPSLIPYFTGSASNTILTFSSANPLRTANPPVALVVNAYITGASNSLGSISSSVSVLPSQVIATPSIVSGTVLNLYKLEPFSYVFSITGVGNTLTLRYTNSSSQLRIFSTLSGDGKTFTFAGTPAASYASTFSLVVDLLDGTTAVSTTTFPVTIGAARVVPSIASPYALNQYENISNTFGSNITITSANDPTTTLSVPTLPLGLSFSNANTIVGTPQVQQPLRNYQLIASNSSNGSIATTNIAISVGVPVVRITPSSAAFTNLNTTSTPTTTFTSLLPATIYGYTFQYLLPVLPSGLFFTDISNVPQSGGFFFTPTDSSNTVKLAGTPDMTDAFGFPSSGIVNVQLAGYFRDATNVQTIGRASLSFQFAETVLLTTTVSSNLYVGKALGSNDVVITADSYFPSTSPIETLVYSGLLPAGLSLSAGPPWYLIGTPTTAGTTSNIVTATNFNGISNTTPLVITINPDIVTFTSTPSNQSYIVSVPLVSNAFRVQASATSGATVTYASSLDFSLYGLTFNTTTGALSGVPLSNLSNTPVTFTATDAFGAFATVSPSFQIQRDVYTWPAYAPTFFQNRTITSFQLVVSTLSGRAIQFFSSTAMPPGLFVSSSGLITGIFTGSTSGTFTVTATTGYQAPSTTASQTYSYTAIADSLLIVQVNGVNTIGTVFSNVQYQTIQYSSDTFVNPVYSVAYVSPVTSPQPILDMTQTGLLSGDFTGVASFPTYTAAITASYAGTTSTQAIIFQSNTVFIPSGFMDFVQPTQSTAVIYQYVPYTFPIQATGSTDFIYYFAAGVPIGFQFTLDPTGTSATLTGISPSNGSASVTLYAKTAFIPATRTTITFNSVIPYFTKSQLGASAYTAILREYVEANAAHNAVNNVVYPVEDQLAGPFMGPQAPDVVTQSNCPKCEPATGPLILPETQLVGYTEAPSGPTPNTGVVTTLAGSTQGYVDGTGAAAQFNQPRGLAVAPDGTIVVADSGNHRIRLVTPAGVVTTLAGSTRGYADGTGAAAQFASPWSAVVRPNGVIVVADTENNCIRLVTPAGVVTTLAGSTTSGSADGTGVAARFSFPSSVALLPNGDIVVCDLGNHRIRLVTPEGVVSTLAGSTEGYIDGTGAAAQFSFPYGVAVLPNSVIAVGDTTNQRIRLVTLAGVVTTLAGSTEGYADGTGAAAQFSFPNGITVLSSSSLIVVADTTNQRIRLVSPTGIVTTFAGSGLGGSNGQFADGIGTAASFGRPNGVAVVPSSGAIVVADTFNHCIRVIAGAF